MPSDLSIHAKDLIWKILKINPEDRVTAEDILSHPLLRKYPSKDSISNNLRAPKVRVEHPINSRDEVDVEIVKNLQTLWHGADREVIIDRLLSPELNPEKTFYCLLMKYRHDHLEDSSSADNTPRTSPHQNRRQQSFNNDKVKNNKLNASQRPTTPSRPSKHTKTASRGSARSFTSSHRKRGVDFSHISKKIQSSTSTPSIKSQNSVQRRQPEYEPPLPESSSMLIAAIDQLSRSMTNDTSPTPEQKSYRQPVARVPVAPARQSYVSRVREDYQPPPSAPVAPLHSQRADYFVRSAKEQKSKSQINSTTDDDEVRKFSAEFAASLCETAFNFSSDRNASGSSYDSQPRAVSTSSEASTASTAPTSVGGRTPQIMDDEFRRDSGPLELKFEPIKSTVHVSESTRGRWVYEFEQYLSQDQPVSVKNMSRTLQPITESDVPPRPPPHTVKRNSASIERFLDADEEDNMASFAAEVENLLNTPPVLKRQSLASSSATESARPFTASSKQSSIVQVRKLSNDSRLRISKIFPNESFYGSVRPERDDVCTADTTRRYLDFSEDNNSISSDNRKVSGQSTASTATTGTTVHHATSNIVEEERTVTIDSERSSREGPSSSLQNGSSLPESAAADLYDKFVMTEASLDMNRMSRISHVLQQPQPRPDTSASMIRPESRVFYRPTVADIGDREHLSEPVSKIAGAALNTHREKSEGTKSSEGETRWVRFHRSLMPKRAAPSPPKVSSAARSGQSFIGRTKSLRKKKGKGPRETGAYLTIEMGIMI